ncbi:MAG: hypothetical protein HQL25_03120 [Candidatus Omnitrophica bacterium]|nr:hypothetical protein [Candidatus Omnitrophota bacterium]
MKSYILVLIILVLFSASGCSHALKLKKKPAVSAVEVSYLPTYLKETKIIDTELLRKGGNLMIMPFLPGTEVSAGPESDTVSVMIVRGFMDVYESQGKEFEKSKIDLIFSDKDLKPNFNISGTIDAMDTPSFFQRHILRRKNMTLTLEGKLKEVETGKTVFIFKDTQSVSIKKGDWAKMARNMGQNLAKWILAEEERQRAVEVIK